MAKYSLLQFHQQASGHAENLEITLKSDIAMKEKNVKEENRHNILQFKRLCTDNLIPSLKVFASEQNITGDADVRNFDEIKRQLQGYIEIIEKAKDVLTKYNVISSKFEARLEKIIAGLRFLYLDESKKKAIKVFFQSDSTTKNPINNTDWRDSANGNSELGNGKLSYDRSKPGKGNTQSDESRNGNTGSGKTTSVDTGSVNTGSSNTGSGNTGSGNTGNGDTGSGITASGNAASDNIQTSAAQHAKLNQTQVAYDTSNMKHHPKASDESDFKTRYQKLSLEYNQVVSKNEHLLAKCNNMTEDVGYKEKYKMLSSSADQMAAENSTLQKKCNQMGDEVKLLNKRLGYADLHIQELATNLSKEMGTKIAANEMSIENVSIRHRPMTISDDYRGFCTDAWHEAKIALDSKIRSSDQATEDSKIIFLEKLLTITSIEIQKVLNEVSDFAGTVALNILNQKLPLQVDKINISAIKKDLHTRGSSSLPPQAQQISNAMGDYLRTEAGSKDQDISSLVTYIFQVINNYSQTTQKEESKHYVEKKKLFMKNAQKPIEQYLKICVDMCWKMAIQRPPMVFKCKGVFKPHREDIQELYWGSDPKKGLSKVLYYVHPALYHGERLMVKGKVFVK